MTNTYVHTQTDACWRSKEGNLPKQRQFGSTTTSWHGLKKSTGFLSLDLKCPHKTKGTTQSAIVKCQM